MKTTLFRKFVTSTVLAAALTSAFVGLTTTTAQAGPVLAPVGPRAPGDYPKVSCGYLEVFSRTEETQWGEGSYYHPHSAYWIYSTDGKRLKTVDNHDSEIDEKPQRVELTPGKYTVRAWSDDDGLVTVPVTIALARTTRVRLESGPDSDEIPAGHVSVGTMKVTANN